MKPHLNEVLKQISEEQKFMLAQAHERYMHLIGISDTGLIDEELLKQDKINYVHLIKRTKDNLPIFNDNDCILFMQSVTGFPDIWCEAWEEYEFVQEHGSVEELIEFSEREQRRIKHNQEQKILEQSYLHHLGQED